MFRVSVVGHRQLGAPWLDVYVSRQCGRILARARAAHPDVVAVSALAVGADTLFAEAAVALGIPLEVVRPFARYEEDFAAGHALARYRALRRAARAEARLAYAIRSDAAYAAAMDWIVDGCDLLVAVWDGSAGVTGSAVRRAERRGRDWYHLNPAGPSATFNARGPRRSLTPP
jgi:hypothetical protein